MPWRSSFPCHRMCCGPNTAILWIALSVFRIADMIGIDRHVSFLLPNKKRKRKKRGTSSGCSGPSTSGGRLTTRCSSSTLGLCRRQRCRLG